METIQDLNSKIVYRLAKVCFVIIALALMAIAFAFVLAWHPYRNELKRCATSESVLSYVQRVFWDGTKPSAVYLSPSDSKSPSLFLFSILPEVSASEEKDFLQTYLDDTKVPRKDRETVFKMIGDGLPVDEIESIIKESGYSSEGATLKPEATKEPSSLSKRIESGWINSPSICQYPEPFRNAIPYALALLASLLVLFWMEVVRRVFYYILLWSLFPKKS